MLLIETFESADSGNTRWSPEFGRTSPTQFSDTCHKSLAPPPSQIATARSCRDSSPSIIKCGLRGARVLSWNVLANSIRSFLRAEVIWRENHRLPEIRRSVSCKGSHPFRHLPEFQRAICAPSVRREFKNTPPIYGIPCDRGIMSSNFFARCRQNSPQKHWFLLGSG